MSERGSCDTLLARDGLKRGGAGERRGDYCSVEEASFEGEGRRERETGEDVIPCN